MSAPTCRQPSEGGEGSARHGVPASRLLIEHRTWELAGPGGLGSIVYSLSSARHDIARSVRETAGVDLVISFTDWDRLEH